MGEFALIGSVITKKVPSYALFMSNPAKFVYWIDSIGNKLKKISNNNWV